LLSLSDPGGAKLNAPPEGRRPSLSGKAVFL
jgi:hypothetical protein